jgi:hypothetical protein
MALKSNGVTQVPDGLGLPGKVLRVNSSGTAGEWGDAVDGRNSVSDGTKLDSIEAGATADQTKADIEGLGIDVPATNLTGTIPAARLSTATTQAESDDSTKIATTAYVVDKITTLIGGAPSTLNDLNELAAAINDDANYNSTLTTALATKLPLAGGTITGDVSFTNGNKAVFGGTGNGELEIYAHATNNNVYISENGGSGNLNLGADNFNIYTNAFTKQVASFTAGSAKLLNDGNEKLATTATGIDVTGNATFADNGKAIFGAGSDLEVYHNGTDSRIAHTGTGHLVLSADNFRLRNNALSQDLMQVNAGGNILLYHNGALKFATTATGINVTGTIEHTYGGVAWQHGEGNFRPVSRKLYSEAGSVGTTGSNITDVYGEADLSAIDSNATFAYAAAWEAVETHGARLPTLSELLDGVGMGSGQSYDSEYLWTCTPAGPHHVWVAPGAHTDSKSPKIVDITDAAEVYRTRGFFDVSRDNRVSTYSSDGHLRDGNDRVFHDGYHPNADTLTTARSIALTGAVTGTANFDGSVGISIATTATADPTLTLAGDATGSATFTNLGNATLTVAIADDSHNHTLANIDQVTINNTNDLDTYNTRGLYNWSSSNPANSPYAYGSMLVLPDGSQSQQLLQTYGGTANTVSLYGRRKTSGTWDTTWTQYFSDHYHPNADTLTTARNINGVAFDGSIDITVADATKLPLAGGTLTGGLTGTSGTFSGTVDVNQLNLRDMGDYITFYGNGTTNHSISSRNNAGTAADDLRINSYGALYINLDSNINNSGGADFVIGRHGEAAGTISNLFTVSGETGDVTVTGDLAISNATPVLSINDTNNGSGGGFIGHIEFNNTSGESFRIGDWSAVDETSTGGPDVLRLRNSNGTRTVFEWGQAGTTAGSLYAYNQRVFADDYHPNADTLTTARNINGVAFDGSDNITVADATKLPLAGGTMTGGLTINENGDSLHLRNTTNGGSVGVSFSSNVPASQIGHLRFSHSDTVTYGSGAAFVLGSTEATTTILADGKLMFDEGIYSKPATGTGAGTRKDANWDTAYTTANTANTTANAALPKAGGTMTGPLIVDTDNNANGGLRLLVNQTNPDQDFYFAQEILSTLSGATVTTADREQGGIWIDLNSTATGGDTSHEHRVYGAYLDVDSTGDADMVYGVFADATVTPSTGANSQVTGGYFKAEDNGGAGTVASVFGVQGLAQSDNATSDTNTLIGGYFKTTNIADTGNVTTASAVYGEIEIAAGTGDHYGTSHVFQAQYDNNDTVAQTNTTYLYYGNYAGVLPTTAYGVYIADAVTSYFGGTIRSAGDVVAYYSDERLKDFHGTIPNAMDKVKQLNGYYFTENQLAKDLGYNNDSTQVGVSAQEVEAVLPEIVKEAAINTEKGTDYKTVQYEKLTALLIEAVKEQQTEIDELKKLVKDLMSR